MSFNLIDLINDQFSDQVRNKLGQFLDGSEARNSLAISSAIPGILSGLINLGVTDKEAVSLFEIINDQDDSILDNLDDLLGGDKQSSILEMGTKSLGSLFGEGSTENLINAVSDYSGSNKNKIGYLIGFLFPIILGVIKRKLLGVEGSFDIDNLRDLLNDQKENVLVAMPFGFSDELESSGFETIILDAEDKLEFEDFDIIDNDIIKFDINDKLDSVNSEIIDLDLTGKAEFITDNVIHSKQVVAKTRKPIMINVLLIAILIGAGFLSYGHFIKGGIENSNFTNSGQMKTLATDRLGKELTSELGNLTKTFGNITDLNSANASLLNLSATTEKLGSLAGKMSKLPEETRKPIVQIVEGNIPLLQNELNKLGNIPGVGEILKPSLKNLSIKLAMFK